MPEGQTPISENPLVSVVIVNWNRVDDLVLTLHYLAKQRYEAMEVVVVDNGSTDGSQGRVRELQEGWGDGRPLRLVELGENLGPATARNRGVEASTGELLYFLDSDALLAKNGLRKLVDRVRAEPDIAVIGCKVINATSLGIDQWIYHQPYEKYGNRGFDTYSFSAAGVMVRADAFKAVGGFWDELFIYNEEVDLSIRVIRCGWRVVYTPDIKVYHRVSPHGRALSGAYFYYQVRNWIWIFYRYYPLGARFRKISVYIGVYLLKGVLSRKLVSCLRGIIAGLRRCELIGRYQPKLSDDQVRRLDSLNRRYLIRKGR
ncbi:MAG: glycosyltransferase family 2 protein [Planctomycetota bacterium]|jgi:GT2 family glycosyltransferase